jgi:hypothetical protein
MKRTLTNRLGRVGGCCLLVLAGMRAGVLPRPAQAGGLEVRSFYAAKTASQSPYSTTADTFDIWCQSDATCVQPPRVTAYPAGQVFVDFYFATNYQTQSVLDLENQMYRFALTIRGSAGAVLVRCTISGLYTTCNNNHAKGRFRVYQSNGMFQVWAPQQLQDSQSSAYPSDTYRADLLIDGHSAAHAAFTVGSGSSHPAAQPAISAFYTIPESIYADWARRDFVRPYRVATFKAGTAMVYFYIAWRNMSSTMPVTLAIRNAQNLPEVQLARSLFTRAGGTEVFGQGLPNEVSYRPGTYTATIQAGPYVSVSTSFTIVS